MTIFDIIAHRGITDHWTENTVPAFRAAYNNHADGIELDIRLSQQDGMVVMHDAGVGRTTRQTGYVHEMTNDRVRGLQPNVGPYVPFLRRVLSLMKREFRGMTLVIEIKKDDNPTDRWNASLEHHIALRDLIRRYNMVNRTIILSFEEQYLIDFKTIAGNIRTCCIIGEAQGQPSIEFAQQFDIIALQASAMTQAYGTQLRNAGVGLMCRASDDPADWRKAKNCGAWGGLTDNVELMRHWRRNLRRA